MAAGLFLTVGLALVVVVHVAGQLAVGRALGLRPRALLGGERPRSWRRAVMVFAGLPANFLGSMLLVFGGTLAGGSSVAYFRVHEVSPGTPADGKLEVGDVIVSVDGHPLFFSPAGLADRVAALGERPIRLTVERKGAPVEVVITPLR